MRLAFGFAIALWLSLPAPGLASRQQDPGSSTKAPPQAPAAPAGKQTASPEAAPAQKSPAETAPTEAAPEKTKTAPAEQAPAETTPAVPANPPTPAPEEKTPDSEAKQKEKVDAGSATEASPPGTSPTGKSPNKARKRRQRTASAPVGTTRRIVVREGGATEPAEQIVPGMTPVEATRQRQNAEQWLASTDDQLKRLAERTLDARQQDTVGQIRNYMEGARTALQEGDVRRASTLAQKAHLLAEDLVKY
jgi:hypothetical protein